MQLSQVIAAHRQYLASFAKPNSQAAYNHLYNHLLKEFLDREIESLTSEEAFNFLNKLTNGRMQATKRLRYQELKAIINFGINNLDIQMKQICSAPALKTAFRAPKRIQKQLPDKEVIDNMIYRTDDPRDRLFISILSTSAMRVGELLKLKVKDVMGEKLILEAPKSGKAFETAYLPKKVAERLHEYIRSKNLGPEDRVFKLSYSGARSLMNRLNAKFNTNIKLHDLRRWCATYASRNGVPLEVISKALLRHSSTSITDRYLMKLSDDDALRYVNALHEK